MFTIRKSHAEVPINAYFGNLITSNKVSDRPAAFASIVATPPSEPKKTPIIIGRLPVTNEFVSLSGLITFFPLAKLEQEME